MKVKCPICGKSGSLVLLVKHYAGYSGKTRKTRSCSLTLRHVEDIILVRHLSEERPKAGLTSAKPVVPELKLEYRHHGCKDCSFGPSDVAECRIREVNYAIYGLRCPQQVRLGIA